MNTTPLPNRKLHASERALILALAPEFAAGLDNALVQEMQDGGMGSVRFQGRNDRRRARQIGEAKCLDDDGVMISIELNVDENNDLFELDLWKVDFSPLLRYPKPEDLRM